MQVRPSTVLALEKKTAVLQRSRTQRRHRCQVEVRARCHFLRILLQTQRRQTFAASAFAHSCPPRGRILTPPRRAGVKQQQQGRRMLGLRLIATASVSEPLQLWYRRHRPPPRVAPPSPLL